MLAAFVKIRASRNTHNLELDAGIFPQHGFASAVDQSLRLMAIATSSMPLVLVE